PDNKVMAWQYLQALPQIAAGASNKLWIVPAELTKLLDGIASRFGDLTEVAGAGAKARAAGDDAEREVARMSEEAAQAVREIETESAAESQNRPIAEQ